MADNEKQNQSSADIQLHAGATVTLKRSLTRRQTTDRNYTTLSTGKIIINRNINNQIKMIIRNFRKFN